MSILSSEAVAQTKKITGTVLDSKGAPIPGVAVVVKGEPTKGAQTNLDGEFLLTTSPKSILVFSFLGYKTKEVVASSFDTVQSIKLEETIQDVGEVVVVGYGIQKKVSVVGAISTVSMKEINRVPAPSLSQALVGKIPGLVSRQTSGEPGQDQAYLYIRGLSNWSDNSPIVVVDGIERDLNSLNVAEIESITFLKDATATAVYGIRGANGVIIVTTKRGAIGAPVITLRSEYAVLSGMRFPDFINAGEYAELWNEALTNNGLSPRFKQEDIRKYYDGSDPYLYPNINWVDQVFRKNTMQTIQNLNISGGSEKIKYFVNLGYTMQDGLFKRDPSFEYNTNVRMHRYNLRSNIDVKLASNLTAEIGLGIISKSQKHPGYDTGTIMDATFAFSPIKVNMYNPDGTFGATIFNVVTNPYLQATHGGYTTEITNNMQGTFKLNWDLSSLITNGLNWSNTFAFDQFAWGKNRRLKGITSKQYLGQSSFGEDMYKVWFEKGPEIYETYSGNNRAMKWLSQMNYNRTFNKHDVGGMLMFNMGESIDLLASNGTAALPARTMGLSGRAVYSYDKRYIVEFSFGYNGSENFAPGHRFGFFPGVAAGWNVANEPFWKVTPVSTLKIRGSYGKVGNDRIGSSRFPYLSTMNAEAEGYLFGESMAHYAGYSENTLGNNDITWEVATKYNVGLDLGFMNDQITLQMDIFREDRSGLLLQRDATIPSVSGFMSSSKPWSNIGKTRNKGIEAMLEAKHTTSYGLFYSLRGNFSFTRSLCIFRDEPINQPEYQSYRGHSLALSSAMVALGIFNSQEEIDNSPRQTFETVVRPGDIKYRDVNGDGLVTSDDEVLVGYPQVPEVNYGFGGTIAYKGFDLSVYFTGAGRSSFFFMGPSVFPFMWGADGNIQREFYEHRWRAGQDNSNAKYPAVRPGANANNNLISTLYMRDGSYLRLKNAEFGYSLPKHIANAIRLSSVRFFVNGIDLFLWDNLDIVDPESNNGNISGYPKQRTINGGIEVTF